MPRKSSPERDAALQAGEATFIGAPCTHGHSKRWTTSRACVACQAAGQRRRRGTILVDDFEELR